MQILPEISNTDDFLGCKLSAILAVISVKMLFVKSLLDWWSSTTERQYQFIFIVTYDNICPFIGIILQQSLNWAKMFFTKNKDTLPIFLLMHPGWYRFCYRSIFEIVFNIAYIYELLKNQIFFYYFKSYLLIDNKAKINYNTIQFVRDDAEYKLLLIVSDHLERKPNLSQS